MSYRRIMVKQNQWMDLVLPRAFHTEKPGKNRFYLGSILSLKHARALVG